MKDRIKTKYSEGKNILYAIFIVYILMLLKIVLFKTCSISEILEWEVSLGYRSMNLIPFKTVADFTEIKNTDFMWAFGNIIGNIGIFMPLGYLLPMLFKRFDKLWKILLISIGLSMTFECMQYFYYLGAMDIDDLILNTIGSISGYGVYYILKGFIVDKNKMNKISILLSVVAFTIAFTIAREQFGSILGLTTQEVSFIGEDNIPEREPDIRGTYLSVKENKLELYKGTVYENSVETEFLETLNIEINEDTEVYYMYSKEDSKYKSTVIYEKLSKEELSKIESYSCIKIWRDNSNPSLGSVIVLSEKLESDGGVYMDTSSSNSDKEVKKDEIVLNGYIEEINKDDIVINLIASQEFQDGSSTSIVGIGENANLINIKLSENTKFKINLINASGELIESKDCKKEELEIECSAEFRGFKENDNFIANYVEIYKIVE